MSGSIWYPGTFLVSTGTFPYRDEWEVVPTYKQKKTYFLCENCGNRHLLPEPKGTDLILLVCASCGGRLREE